jgi:hypothetical protein
MSEETTMDVVGVATDKIPDDVAERAAEEDVDGGNRVSEEPIDDDTPLEDTAGDDTAEGGIAEEDTAEGIELEAAGLAETGPSAKHAPVDGKQVLSYSRTLDVVTSSPLSLGGLL